VHMELADVQVAQGSGGAARKDRAVTQQRKRHDIHRSAAGCTYGRSCSAKHCWSGLGGCMVNVVTDSRQTRKLVHIGSCAQLGSSWTSWRARLQWWSCAQTSRSAWKLSGTDTNGHTLHAKGGRTVWIYARTHVPRRLSYYCSSPAYCMFGRKVVSSGGRLHPSK